MKYVLLLRGPAMIAIMWQRTDQWTKSKTNVENRIKRVAKNSQAI